MEYSKEIVLELAKARQARERGLEGRARVCARRAAGLAIRAYLSRQSMDDQGTSSLALLQSFEKMANVPEHVKLLCRHLLLRVDGDYHLPPDVDLIKDAENLVNFLSKEA